MAGTNDLEIRENLTESYSDVYTPAALDAMSALADVNRQRLEVMTARIERRQRRARDHELIGFLDPHSMVPGNQPDSTGRTRRKFRRNRNTGRPPATVDPGHGTRGEAACSGGKQYPQRGLCSPVRCGWMDVRRRGCPRAGLDHVAGQPAESQIGLRQGPYLSRGCRACSWRDEWLGRLVLRPSDRRELGKTARFHHQNLPVSRPAPRRPPRTLHRRNWILSFHRRHGSLRGEQPRAPSSSQARRSSCISRRFKLPKRPPSGTSY